MAEKISVMYSEEEVNARIREVAEEINRDYAGEPLHLVGILKGSIMFMSELAKRLDMPVTMDFMSVSSYGASTKSSGVIRIKKYMDETLNGKNVLIVEDIIDSGNTLSYLQKLFALEKPKSMKLCTLLDKPERREQEDVHVDYHCFTIPDAFVVGYGLDYDQKYRNLPYVGVISFDD